MSSSKTPTSSSDVHKSSSDAPTDTPKSWSSTSESSSDIFKYFSPAIPIPSIFDREKYIAQLKDYLDPKSPHHEPPQQHANIKKLIELYETGQRKDNFTTIYIRKGEVITQEQFWAVADWCFVDVSSDISCHELLLTSEFRVRLTNFTVALMVL